VTKKQVDRQVRYTGRRAIGGPGCAGSVSALAGAFDGEVLEDPENVQRVLQGMLGLVLAKVRRNFILASPAPPRLLEVLSSSSLPHASEWLLALLVPRVGQAMMTLDFMCRLRNILAFPSSQQGFCVLAD
jgi:hypothetical protein